MRYLALVIPSMRYAISQGYNKGATGSALHLSRRDALHPICPALERGAHVSFITCAVIDTSNAALVAGHMIKHCLDDVGLHAKFGHAGGASAAQIVQMPICNVQALVQPRLGAVPIFVALHIAEQKGRGITSRLTLDNCQRLTRER